jgi:hypothetical protein
VRDRREDLAHLGLMLRGLAAVVQASSFDGVTFDPFSFQQDAALENAFDLAHSQLEAVLVDRA